MATNDEIVSFLNTISKLVVNEALRRAATGKPFVLPSVCIAQAAHETGWGTSTRMVKSNAYFGIKAGGSWTGKVYTADTWEVVDGSSYNTSANFRAYDSLADSIADYMDLISLPRYAAALSTKNNVLTPAATISAIHSGGYATDPLYVDLILSIIKGRNLTQYDDTLITTLNSGIGGSEIPEIDTPYTPPVVTEAESITYVFEKI